MTAPHADQLIDGYLSGRSSAELVPAAHKVSGCIDRPVVDLGVGVQAP